MKTRIVTILILLTYSQHIQAQTDSAERQVAPVTVTLMTADYTLKREIYETADSAILLRIPLLQGRKDSLPVYSSLSIPVARIQTITYRKEAVGKGIWHGALIGFGVGAMFGLIVGINDGSKEGDWMYIPPEAIALGTGLLCTLPGILIGGIIGGHAKVVIPINGSQENYNKHRSRLVEYSVRKK